MDVSSLPERAPARRFQFRAAEWFPLSAGAWSELFVDFALPFWILAIDTQNLPIEKKSVEPAVDESHCLCGASLRQGELYPVTLTVGDLAPS